jgi:hypothetical protein
LSQVPQNRPACSPLVSLLRGQSLPDLGKNYTVRMQLNRIPGARIPLFSSDLQIHFQVEA